MDISLKNARFFYANAYDVKALRIFAFYSKLK